MSPRIRWTALLSALAGAVWLATGGPQPAGPDVVEAANRQVSAQASAPAAEPQILALAPRTASAEGKSLFATTSWAPPPAKPAPPPPPPPPTAPPLPFKYVGKQRVGDGWEVFVARGEQIVVVRAGAIVDGTYRVDEVKPPTMVLTYVPLNERQSLSIGEAE